MKRSLIRFAVLILTISPALAFAVEPRGMVYDFGASWCGPCQQVAPTVAKLEREGLPIRKVDIDKEKELADRFRIDRVPTFVLVVDGKEVSRKSGAMSEAEIRRLIARIPQSTGTPAKDSGFPIELGEPGVIPQPRQEPMQSEIRLASNEQPKMGVKDLWPFSKNEQPPTVRGNDTELDNAADFAINQGSPEAFDPMRASVRIRVIMGSKINLGSGTIISSAPGFTQILTCGHIFRDFNDDSKIEVDLFQDGQSKLYIARLQTFNLESDLGVIAIPTEHALAAAIVPDVDGQPNVAEQVAGIGCSGGNEPTREQLRVTALDKYEGPSTIECTGLPVQGRSGGGLFNMQGEIIGVCIAADKKEHKGLYSGLMAVHKLLDECKLTALYKTESPDVAEPIKSIAMIDEQPAVPDSSSWPESVSSSAPAPMVNSPATEQSPVNLETGNAEVVVIIRDKSRPDAPNRVVIIHDASSKFFAYLDGELGDSTPAMPLSSLARPLRTSRGANTMVSQHSQPGLAYPSASKALLTPTALSQPVTPKRYTRNSNGSH